VVVVVVMVVVVVVVVVDCPHFSCLKLILQVVVVVRLAAGTVCRTSQRRS